MPKLSSIEAQATSLTGRAIVPDSRQRRTCGPSRGWPSSQASKRGEDREKHQAAMIRKTVPGISGRIMPTTPIAVRTQPAANRKGRR